MVFALTGNANRRRLPLLLGLGAVLFGSLLCFVKEFRMWFIEDPWPPVLILAVVAIVFVLMWNANRRGLHLLLALGTVLLGLMVLIVEEMIVTEAEEVEARVYELADAVRQGQHQKVLGFLADDASNLRAELSSRIEDVEVRDYLRITDLEVTHEPDSNEAESHFRANGTVTYQKTLTQTGPTRWNLTWEKTDGEWKIIQVERLHPVTGEVINTWSHL